VLAASLDGSDAAVAPVWSPEGGGMLTARFGDLGGTPLFGIDPVLVDMVGRRASGSGAEGELCVKRSWPAQPRSAEQDHQGFLSQRLERFPGPTAPDSDAGSWPTGASPRPGSSG
jgi:acyl-coenzyme A synthetase/AMP-(fatty) acid ligase